MRMLILNQAALNQLDDLNRTGNPTRQLCTVDLPGPSWGLNVDLLNDCGPGQTWAHYRTLLQSLPQREVGANELPSEANPDGYWSIHKVNARYAARPLPQGSP